MKITKDSVGNVILNDGSHRVVLSSALVEAIGEQVYVDSPRGECEGRMVVVDLGEVAAGESEPVAYPASFLPVCESCCVPAVLESVQGGGPECALSCPKCGAGWSEELSGDVIETLLGTEEEPITGYGAFPGGDPRLFDPDPECSTPEEREAHRVACQEADAMEARGEVPSEAPAHHWGFCAGAGVHVAGSGFGLGVYQSDVAERDDSG